MIDVDGLTFAYGADGPQALSDVDLHVDAGAYLAVAGPSGSGKSTLLRAIGGLVPEFHGGRMQGRVELAGDDTRETAARDRADRVGWVFQDPESQIVTGTVRAEVAFPLENLGVDPDRGRRMVDEALAAAGIAHLADRDTDGLSDGQLQRVAVAAAIAPEPDVLLLDEPTANLDGSAARDVLGAVAGLRDDLGLTVVHAAHRLDRVAPAADRLVALVDGRLVADGPPADVLAGDVADKTDLRRPPVLDVADRLHQTGHPLTVAEARRLLDGLPDADPPRHDVAEDRVAEVDDVAYAYDETVLDSVTLDIRKGETLGLMGASGAGKTTLAEILAGKRQPDAGRVQVQGRDPADLRPRERADRVGLVPSDPGRILFEDHVRDEVEASLADRDLYGADVWTDRLLSDLDLADVADRHPESLSGGQRQRLAVAAVAVRNPAVLVLDEPTRGLDPRHAEGLARLIDRRSRMGRATVLATHDADLVARTCDRVAVLAGHGLSGPDEVHDALGVGRVHTTQVSLLDRALGGDGRTLTVDELEGPP